ncbi:MAG: choice-of-anchor R domain-containing protein [Candidatus Acidiferrales bacterium]
MRQRVICIAFAIAILLLALFAAPVAHSASAVTAVVPPPQPILCGANAIAHNHSAGVATNAMSGSGCVTGPAGMGYTVESCSVWIAAGSGNIACAIYSDVNGAPGQLVCSSAPQTITPNALNTIALTGCGTLFPRTLYWIEFNSDSAGVQLGEGSTGALCSTNTASRSAASTFGAWPSSFPAAQPGACAYESYITLDAVLSSPQMTLGIVSGLSTAVNLTSLLAFPGCLDSSGNPISNCTTGWRVCGNAAGTSPSVNSNPPQTQPTQACIDFYPGDNTLGISLLKNTPSQTTVFAAGSFTLTLYAAPRSGTLP